MRGVFFPGDKKVEIREIEKPSPRMGEVLIKMKASAICRSDHELVSWYICIRRNRNGSKYPRS